LITLYSADIPYTKATTFSLAGGKATIQATDSDFTFTTPPLITTAPANYDISTKVPTTAWINSTNGWKYTLTNTMTASTTTTFSSCFSAGNFNSYQVNFIFNLTAPTTGYLGCSITLLGLITPNYYLWTTSTSTTPSITNVYNGSATSIPIISSMDAASNTGIRSQQPKINLWGCITNPLVSVPQIQFSAENFSYANPGIVGMGKAFGYCQGASGSLSGITLTFSTAMTGSVSIIATSSG
jgi:hypothetical protein